MKRLMITGFAPFGGDKINPSWEAVSRLPDRIGGYEVFKCLIPVEFGHAGEIALEKAEMPAIEKLYLAVFSEDNGYLQNWIPAVIEDIEEFLDDYYIENTGIYLKSKKNKEILNKVKGTIE